MILHMYTTMLSIKVVKYRKKFRVRFSVKFLSNIADHRIIIEHGGNELRQPVVIVGCGTNERRKSWD